MTAGELWLLMGVKLDEGSVKKANGVLEGLRSRAMALLSIRGVESVMGLVQNVTDSATHLIAYSAAMGMTIERTQEWGYVAEQSGSNLKELTTGMNMFIRNVDKFRKGQGGKQMRALLGEAGVTNGSANKMFSEKDGVTQQLLAVADHIKKLGATSKAAEATMTQLFGVKAGKAMLADLARGKEGIEALMARRRAMGELDQKQAENLRDLGNHLKDVKTQFGAIASQVIAKLAPGLLKMADAALAWMSANQGLISGALAGALEVVAGIFSTIGDVISWLTELVHDAFDGDTGAQAILIGLAAAIMSVVVPALWAMAAPMIVALAPFIAIAAAVAAISYGVLQLAKHWDGVTDAIGSVVTKIKNTLGAVFSWLYDEDQAIIDHILAIPQAIWDALVGAYELVRDTIFDAMDAIAKKVRDTWEDMKDIPIIGHVFSGAEKLANFVTGSGDSKSPTTSAPTTNVVGGGGAPGTVSIGPTTVQINGVKGAAEASEHIADNIDQRTRQAAAALAPGAR